MPIRLRPTISAATLRWDGSRLQGEAGGSSVVVEVPARFVSFRSEVLPPAAEAALKAATRLRAERAFAPLGPVAIDALLPKPVGGSVHAVIMALPRTTMQAIQQAAQLQGLRVKAIRIAEFLRPIPPGGIVEVAGEACLIAHDGEYPRGIAALGPISASGFTDRVSRERLRLDVAEDAPAGPIVGAAIDFLHPRLHAPPALLSRPRVRLGLLVVGVAALIVVAVSVHLADVIAARDAAQQQAEQQRPLVAALAARRADLKEVAPWFDQRPSMSPALHVLAQALPALESAEQVRLVRVRQIAGEEVVAEGAAGDRAQMMSFLLRVRQDPRVRSAEIRSSRSPAKESKAVVFEIVLHLGARDAVASAAEKGGDNASS